MYKCAETMKNGTTAPLERLGGNKQDPINHKSQILILFILMRPVNYVL